MTEADVLERSFKEYCREHGLSEEEVQAEWAAMKADLEEIDLPGDWREEIYCCGRLVESTVDGVPVCIACGRTF